MFSGFGLLTKKKINKIGFEDVQTISKTSTLLINTLSIELQHCLIVHTLPCHEEEKVVNGLIDRFQYKEKTIVVYGKHSADPSVEQKYNQLIELGFTKVYIYYGGLFEWLLLQDIYGVDEFPTTQKVLDILKYKPDRLLS
jgi:hypothetical protein